MQPWEHALDRPEKSSPLTDFEDQCEQEVKTKTELSIACLSVEGIKRQLTELIIIQMQMGTTKRYYFTPTQFISVQFSSSVMSNSL